MKSTAASLVRSRMKNGTCLEFDFLIILYCIMFFSERRQKLFNDLWVTFFTALWNTARIFPMLFYSYQNFLSRSSVPNQNTSGRFSISTLLIFMVYCTAFKHSFHHSIWELSIHPSSTYMNMFRLFYVALLEKLLLTISGLFSLKV